MSAKQNQFLHGLQQTGLLLSWLIFCSCSYVYQIHITPADAVVEVGGIKLTVPGKYPAKLSTISVKAYREGYEDFLGTYTHKDFFKPKSIDITLEKRQYEVAITVLDDPSQYSIDGSINGTTPVTLKLTHDKHTLVLTREEYAPQTIELDITQPAAYVFRHQQKDPGLKPVGIFNCGNQPKQLNFSPDNRYIYIALLDDYGFEIFDVEKLAMVEKVDLKKVTSSRGFVEGLFIPRYSSYLVTQMQTGLIYEFSADEQHTFKRKISSGGKWPKVLAYSESLDLLAVSNWMSSTVVLIDYRSGKEVKTITDLATPRGVAFTHDGKHLVICSYDGGFIKRYGTTDWKESGKIAAKYAAMRHVVITRDDKSCYVSDMGHSQVYDIDLESFKIRKIYPTFHLTNTIELSPDERFLFASCRGPNDPVSYYYRSPENGQVTIIDVKKQEVAGRIYGGNQPTGLDVSSDGKYLCFSNFKDNNFELYELAGLYR